MQCIKCQSILEAIGTSTGTEDNFLTGVNYKCPKCQIFYKDDEPVAIQKNNTIINLKE